MKPRKTNKVSGTDIVWVDEYNGKRYYKFNMGSRNEDGTWINAKQPIRFRQGVRISNGTWIDYEGFETVAPGKNGNYTIWQILKYTELKEDVDVPVETQYSALTNDDIPF